MVEKLLTCLEGKPATHQDSLLSLIVDGIKYLELKQNDNSNIEKYGLVNSPKLRKHFLDYLFNFLLLPYTQNTPGTAIADNNQQSANQGPEIPACLSEAAFKQFKNDVNFENGDEIEQIKIGILKFLSFNIYNCEEVIFHFIISSSDTRYNF